MAEQHAFVGDRDDVIVERPRRDRIFRLRGENDALGIELVQPRDRPWTPRHAAAPGKRRLTLRRRKSRRRVRHALRQGACDWPRPRRRMPAGPADGPRRTADPRRRSATARAVERHSRLRCGMDLQIGDRQMAFAVGGIRRRRNRCRVGGPHRGCRHRIGGKRRLRLLDGRAETGEPVAVRSRMGQKDALAQARARDWRASCPGPRAPRAAAPTLARRGASRRHCRSSGPRNCGSARRSRRN